MQISLANYNRSVLDFAMIPTSYLVTQIFNNSLLESLIDAGPKGLEQFQTNLSYPGIDIHGMSGSWTPEFADLILPLTCLLHNCQTPHLIPHLCFCSSFPRFSAWSAFGPLFCGSLASFIGSFPILCVIRGLPPPVDRQMIFSDFSIITAVPKAEHSLFVAIESISLGEY